MIPAVLVPHVAARSAVELAEKEGRIVDKKQADELGKKTQRAVKSAQEKAMNFVSLV